ncbi:hypothetical protein CKA32_006268 [Geitlerinema sp. FC II]|nr:hypothetical protein CKA32_006268 [Geitlerinema sp. FC II]
MEYSRFRSMNSAYLFFFPIAVADLSSIIAIRQQKQPSLGTQLYPIGLSEF